MKPRKTPQEKKRLSLAKDRRKRTGGNVHTARKAHAKAKRELHGAQRGKARRILGSGKPVDPDGVENALKGMEKGKIRPDRSLPLGESVAAKRRERISRHGRRKEFRRLTGIYRKALAECRAALRKTARYQDADAGKVERVARSRLKAFHRDLFAEFHA